MTKHRSGGLAVLLAASALAGCAPMQPPRLDVERQWSEAVNNLGLFAVYPPSEDVMVGDAFLYLPDAKYFDLVRVTSAPLPLLARQFCYQEQDRMAVDTVIGGKSGVVKPAPAKGATSNPCADARQQQIATHDGTVGTGHATRLREADVPILEVGRFSEGELAGAGLLGNFGGALGIGTSGQAAMRVQLKNLQSLTMDELRGSRLLEDITQSRVERVRGGRPDYPNSLTPLMLARSLRLADQRNGTDLSGQFCSGAFDALNAAGVRVVVANRVLYAGGVSFEFMNSQVTSVKLAVDFASVLAGMPQRPVVPSGLGAKRQAKPKEGEDGGAGAAPDPKKEAEKKEAEKKEAEKKAAEAAARAPLDTQLAALLTRLQGLATLDTDKAGQVAGRLATGRFGNLAMEKNFTRPAAVGMGAALHFPIGEAAVPAGPGQIDEVVAFCNATHGVADLKLWDQLMANYRWAYFLYRRETVGVSAALADADAEVGRMREQAGLPRKAPESATAGTIPRRGLLPAIRIDAKLRP